MEIFQRSPSFFKPHPNNSEIYDDAEIEDDLYFSIQEKGVLQPLTCLEDGTVLSGHRRLARAKKLKMKLIPTIIVQAVADGDPLALLEMMLEYNRYREKTVMEKYREACAYETIFVRRKGAGRTSYHIAQATGIGSARQLERLTYVVKNAPATLIKKIDQGEASISGVYDDLIKLKKEPDEIREQAASKVESGESPTVAEAIKEVKIEKAASRRSDPQATGLEESDFEFINILPNWDYSDIGRTHPGNHWAKKSAPVMDSQQLADLCIKDVPISELGAERSVLVLWVPSALSDLGSGVLQSYGYELAHKLFWCKEQPHAERVLSLFHDCVLEGFVGTRGDYDHQPLTNWFSGSAPQGQLPEYFYAMMSHIGFRSALEVFTSVKRKGFAHYG